MNKFDMIVIGGGSGGLAAARRASEYGANCAVIENDRLGGTCVNVGCVPKKVMWTTSRIAEILHDASDYGFSFNNTSFDWSKIKQSRDAYITRLNNIYQANLEKANVAYINGQASFVSSQSVRVSSTVYEAPQILIATGGQPIVPPIPGAEHAITSDGFFEMAHLPDKVIITGAGYIATEFAGVLRGLGSEVIMVLRKDQLLRGFDSSLTAIVMDEMKKSGVQFVLNNSTTRIAKTGSTLRVELSNAPAIEDVNEFIFAIGRKPNSDELNLSAAGVDTDVKGFIETDRFQATSNPDIYAVGDVTGRVALTPVAIAAGRRLADRLFGGQPDAHLDYENIPSVIFSHPPIGTVGLSEAAARERFGHDIKVYTSQFINMYYQVTHRTSPTLMKLITTGADERIVGCHIIGDSADEIIQGFSVAVKMGARKRDFDNTVAIHPTASEEFVTMR